MITSIAYHKKAYTHEGRKIISYGKRGRKQRDGTRQLSKVSMLGEQGGVKKHCRHRHHIDTG